MIKWLVAFFFVTPIALWAISDEELLKKVDSLASYYDVDFSAEYTIVQDKPGQNRSTTVAGVFRRDSEELYTIIIIQPIINKGQGYLKQGGTLWFYDPESKRFNSTSSRDRFQNSNARNSDFTRSTLAEDYSISASEGDVLGRFQCRVLSLTATNNEVSYPRMKVWISEDGLVRKTEDYSLSGQLLRTSAIPEYYKIGERYVPKAILLVDALRGAMVNGVFVNEKTQITITKPSFAPVSNAVFSKTYLEKAAR
ncbi:MAG: outer membrane lipoprotein-sorting protein [Spirochaetaceae bacterium]|jgi:outer membrane lipoprotein-sorting protein|nr:outer membrane lipoprotein-sorting protein [Spirochaetaceae bacterium]